MRRAAAAGAAAAVAAGVVLLALPASATTTSSACPSGAVPPSGFVDVPAGAADIDCLVWWGVTAGATATTYEPAAAVTRGQMASFLARTARRAGGTVPDVGHTVFWDTTGTVHHDAATQLSVMGIVSGTGNGELRPHDPVRRDQMASFLVRLAETLLGEPLPSQPTGFPDVEGNLHLPAIEKLVATGITAGKADGRYDPSGSVTRSQMASFLLRTVDVLVRDRLSLVRLRTPDGSPTHLTVTDGRAARTVPPGGTLAVADGARAFLPPVGRGSSLRLPEESPVVLPTSSQGVAGVEVAYRSATPEAVDQDNSASVLAHVDHFFVRPAEVLQPDWTGSVETCTPGTTAQAWRDAQLAAANAARALVDLPPVTEDPEWSRLAQETALLMAANNDLSHDPDPSWRCWSQDGFDGARTSNLFLGAWGVDAVGGYLDDGGVPSLGHRRWILGHAQAHLGFGDVRAPGGTVFNAMRVIGASAPLHTEPVSWPAPGQFPEMLVGPRTWWSLSVPEVDLSAATVTLEVDGAPASTTVHHPGAGYGAADAVAFTVPPGVAFRPVTVTVTAETTDGEPFEHTWTSTLVR
jgi:uncharacterized protein YkwD